jgi:dihydroorotate dehydrogenase
MIAVGGISDSASANEKFGAGAQLLQIYSGLIFRGPSLLRDIAAAC